MKETIEKPEEVCKRLKISPTTLWRWRKAGVFPEPIRLGGTNLIGWPSSQVDEWIETNGKLDDRGKGQ